MPTKFQLDDAQLMKIAQYCRATIDVHDGACMDRRVEYFHGDDMVDLLMSKSFRKKKFCEMPEEVTRETGLAIATALAESRNVNFFHKAIITNKLTKSVDYDELDQLTPDQNGSMEDNDDAVYVWLISGSKMKSILLSVTLVAIGIAFTMIKVWPLWMKIVVWWLSLIMLVSMLSLLVLRIIFAALFWMVGFRGLWLLPNMLNDDLPVLDAFSPFVGYGITSKEFRQQQKSARLAANARLTKKSSKGVPVPTPANADGTPAPVAERVEGRHECDFGLLNLGFILIGGLILCNALGLFMPENIPEFVTTRADLFAHFPSLAPPDYNATAEAIAAEAAAAAAVAAEKNGSVPIPPKAEPAGTASDGVKISGMGESEELNDDDIVDDVQMENNEKYRNKHDGEEITEDLD